MTAFDKAKTCEDTTKGSGLFSLDWKQGGYATRVYKIMFYRED